MFLPLNPAQTVAKDSVDGNYVVIAGPGSGKCLCAGTPVLLYDGSIKKVEDVKKGDLLMGPDSLPRTVLGTATGVDDMYQVTPIKGDSFICNKDHILSIKLSGKRFGNRSTHGFNISVLDYLKRGAKFKQKAKLWRTGVDWVSQEVPVDPYFLGLWLGDGNSELDHLAVSKPDKEIEDYLRSFGAVNGLSLSNRNKTNKEKCPTWSLSSGSYKGKPRANRNPLLSKLQALGLSNNKHIPEIYKINSKETRLQLLAGLLDADGYLSNGSFDIVLKQERLANDLVFLCRSLGFAAYIKPCKKSIKSIGFIGDYFRISISGSFEMVPTIIPRRKAEPRKQIKRVLVTGFKVSPVGWGRYYGFELDGDGLFLLGDFTVTHNTATLIQRYLGMLQRGIPTHQMLNLTFTSAAAIEMVERVGLLNADKVFRTFHSYALDLLQRERVFVPFQMCDTIIPVYGQSVKLLRDLMKVYPAISSFRVLRDKIAEWKCSNIEPEEAIDLEYNNGPAFFMAQAYKDYERRCREEGWLDFDSLMKETVKLLESNSEVRERNKKKYIAVDECQDTDVVQFKLLQLIYGGNIFAVGDENQLIYEWRSAQNGSLSNFEKVFPGAKTLYLGQNYRSTVSLVRFFKKITPVDNGLASHMTTDRPEGVPPLITKFTDDMQEASIVLARITEPNESAIIARTNRQLLLIQKRCMARGLKSVILGRKNLWQQPEVAHLLKLAKDKQFSGRPAHEVLTELIAVNNLLYLYRNSGSPMEKDPAENLNDMVKMSVKKGTVPEFLTWLRKLTYASKSKKKVEQIITLTTVHQAKGREWKHVFLVGASQGLLPHKEGELLEEHRIFFVGCSRAADTLEISFYGNRSQFLNDFQSEVKIYGERHGTTAGGSPAGEVESEEDRQDSDE